MKKLHFHKYGKPINYVRAVDVEDPLTKLPIPCVVINTYKYCQVCGKKKKTYNIEEFTSIASRDSFLEYEIYMNGAQLIV